MNPRSLSILLVALTVNVADAKAADALSKSGAAALVETMQMDRSSLLGFQAAIRNGFKDGKVTQKTLDCAEKIPPTALTQIYVAGVETVMTPAEIADALEFYRGPTGSRVVALGLRQLQEKIGNAAPGTAPTLTQQELKAVEVFAKTSAGNKLMFERVLEAPTIMGPLKAELGRLYGSCR